MKIILIIALISIITVNSIKLENQLTSKIEPAKLDSIKEVLNLSMKSGTEYKENSPVAVCLGLMTQAKYEKALGLFWDKLTKIFSSGSPRPYLLVSEVDTFVHETGKSESLKDGRNCGDLLTGALDTEDELMSRGNKMKEQILPLNPGKTATVLEAKHFISAFTGVHRFTKESAALIPKLNRK